MNFCSQIERAARSASSNVAEGFGRYQPDDNARFVRIALGSLYETQSLVGEALTKKYIEESESTELGILLRRAIGTNVNWHNHLKKCPRQPRRPKNPDSPNRPYLYNPITLLTLSTLP